MPEARFVTGSIPRHIIVMTSTATVGLMGLFLVDLLDMYFLSLLGEVALAAAIGYAGSILFFNTSIAIGVAIAMAALVARAVGAGQQAQAKRTVANVLIFALIVTLPLAGLIWLAVPVLLDALGASGQAHALASAYLRIIVPTLPILTLSMSAGGVLRAIGAPRWTMTATLVGAAVNAVLDPIFIFALGLGVEGAAIASVLARVATLAVGAWGMIVWGDMLGRTTVKDWFAGLRPIVAVALPSMLTNVATPLGNAYVTFGIAQFGDGAVAGYSIIGRVVPVAFAIVFALSGAVGPIFGQNFGAGRVDRLRRILMHSLAFCAVVVAVVALLLFLLRHHVVALFGMADEAAALIIFFCSFVAVSYAFSGAQFIANAAFNNLGKPTWSTLSNWAKATLGTVPFCWLGGVWFGAEGVLAGQALGGVIFGSAVTAASFALVARVARDGVARPEPDPLAGLALRVPLSTHTAYRGWVGLFRRR